MKGACPQQKKLTLLMPFLYSLSGFPNVNATMSMTFI